VVKGTPVPPRSIPPGFKPEKWLELVWWSVDTMNWSRTWQLLVLPVVPLALVFGGLGLLAHAIVGTPAFWSAIGVVAGGSTGAVTYGVARRRQRRIEQRGNDGRGPVGAATCPLARS
jgi:hypothetical protein